MTKNPPKNPDFGSKRAEYLAGYHKQARQSARDIGDGYDELVSKINWKKRKSFRNDYEGFVKYYLNNLFYNPFTDHHRQVIDALVGRLTYGGYQAVAAPRGDGKTSIVVAFVIWAILYGKVRLAVLVAANRAAAESLLDEIKNYLEHNELLNRDFPDVCYPIKMLEGASQRCKGQTVHGERTRIGWKGDEVVFPHVKLKGKVSDASGAIVTTRGIDSAIRGIVKGGVRPDIIICDDLETRESARSSTEIENRKKTVSSDILGSAGPDKLMPVVLLCTIIARGCLADQLTNNKESPAWNGIRQRRVIEWPKNKDLWDEYLDLREKCQSEGDAYSRKAHLFYLKNRDVMDEGSVVSNPYRYRPHLLDDAGGDENTLEVSALQAAYNDMMDFGYDAFMSEFQNDPVVEKAEISRIEAHHICNKINRHARRGVPSGVSKITRFVDCGSKWLHWAVVGWCEGMVGYILDYGTESVNSPDGNIPDEKERAKQIQIAIFDALNRIYHQEKSGYPSIATGEMLPVNITLVDAGYMPDAVMSFCSSKVDNWMPAIGGSGMLARYRSPKPTMKGVRYIGSGFHQSLQRGNVWTWVHDATHFKLLAQEGLRVPDVDTKGSISLFGSNPSEHKTFARHICAESFDPDKRKFIELSKQNHWLDCVAGCCLCASILGFKVVDISQRKEDAKKLHREPVRSIRPPIKKRTLIRTSY